MDCNCVNKVGDMTMKDKDRDVKDTAWRYVWTLHHTLYD